MAKIRLYTSAIVVTDDSDKILQQFTAGSYILELGSNGTLIVKGEGATAIFSALATITAITDANNNPVTIPATPEEYVTLITGYFRSLVSSGGGGSVTVLNFPDDFPDGAANTKLTATNGLLGEMLGAQDIANETLGQGGTTEAATIPDSPAAGSGMRKIGFRILQFITGINDFLTTMQPDTNAIRIASQSVDSKLSSGISVRDADFAPVSVAGKAWTSGEVLGGSIDVSDAFGVVYSFATSGNSGAGSLNAWYSQDGITWVATYCYFWGPTSENATYATALAAANLNSSQNQVYIPAMARYVRLTAPAGAVTTGTFYTRKVAKVPLPVLRNVNPAPVSLAAGQSISIATYGGNGFTISTTGTFNLLYGPTVGFAVLLLQFNKNTATALSGTIEGSINGTDFVPAIDTLNLADFTVAEIAKVIKDKPFYAYRANITAITGAIIFRGFRTNM